MHVYRYVEFTPPNRQTKTIGQCRAWRECTEFKCISSPLTTNLHSCFDDAVHWTYGKVRTKLSCIPLVPVTGQNGMAVLKCSHSEMPEFSGFQSQACISKREAPLFSGVSCGSSGGGGWGGPAHPAVPTEFRVDVVLMMQCFSHAWFCITSVSLSILILYWIKLSTTGPRYVW